MGTRQAKFARGFPRLVESHYGLCSTHPARTPCVNVAPSSETANTAKIVLMNFMCISSKILRIDLFLVKAS